MVPAPSLPWETLEAVGKKSWGGGLFNAWMTWRLQLPLSCYRMDGKWISSHAGSKELMMDCVRSPGHVQAHPTVQ